MCTTTVPAPTAEPAPDTDQRPLVRYERDGTTVEGRLVEVTRDAVLIGDQPCWTYGKFNLTRTG